MDEDEGEAGEGEAPLEDEEDDFNSDLEGDWDTVRKGNGEGGGRGCTHVLHVLVVRLATRPRERRHGRNYLER